VHILVERVWWTLGEVSRKPSPSQWGASCLTLSRQDFSATSQRALWLQLPRPRWVDRIWVGFARANARPYSVGASTNEMAIPLRDFTDSGEVNDSAHEHPLKVWIQPAHQPGEEEGVIAILPARMAVGSGRKKTALARAELHPGTGNITIQGLTIDRYFKGAPPKARRFFQRLLTLEPVAALLSHMEVQITIQGSSPKTTRQAKAAAHALARALMRYDPELTKVLKQAGFGGVRVKQRR